MNLRQLTGPAKAPPGAADPSIEDEVEASRAPLMDHLIELRTRMVRSLVALIVLFVAAWFVTMPALEVLVKPLGDAAARHERIIPELQQPATSAPAPGEANAPRPKEERAVMQATSAMEVVLVRMQLALLIALAVGFPYFAYQLYAFVAPGLYKNERSAVLPYLFVMPMLFTLGAAVVYFYVLPLFMDISYSQEFQTAGVDTKFQPKVKEYYSLAISLLTMFGLAFQLPVVMSLLAHGRVMEASTLRKGRKYAFVVIVIVAAVMTPPDPFSLFLLAIPLYLLYESGIISTAMIERARKKREDEEAKAEAEEAARESEGAKPA